MKEPKDFLSLASGSSYFYSPDAAVTAAMAAMQSGQTFYGPTEGIPDLRQAIAARYTLQGQGAPLHPDQVLVTPGCRQALFNLFMVLLRAGDEVVIPTPAWFGFDQLLKYSHGRSVAVPTLASENYTLTPALLRQTLTARSRILILTNPGNPTGRIYTKAELEALLDVVNEFPNLYVISDEIYDLVTYGQPVISILSCQGAPPERTFVVNGFSKAFAMSGWRLGYIAGPEAVLKKCTEFQGSTFSDVSMFLQEAALATLQHLPDVLTPMLEVLHRHREIMRDGLAELPQVKYTSPEGAYYFFPDFSAYIGRTTPAGLRIRTSIDLFKYLREKHKLELVPGDKFKAPGFARLSFAVTQPVLVAAMQRLKEALSQLRLF